MSWRTCILSFIALSGIWFSITPVLLPSASTSTTYGDKDAAPPISNEFSDASSLAGGTGHHDEAETIKVPERIGLKLVYGRQGDHGNQDSKTRKEETTGEVEDRPGDGSSTDGDGEKAGAGEAAGNGEPPGQGCDFSQVEERCENYITPNNECCAGE
ncbi:hypothetical protein J5289_28855 (plasmid) [Rhizobium sp. B230/85]|uniref:hypothetical protein n=1 Tax=unclassified Rhizobium TaxID=2613769 RepID=UPI001AD9EDFC|nr:MULTISPECIES: hypothetical protein [unclassified Rhizobium]MBO9136241.1 hypothetical protein [Rhizobium sp. B209b/85]QXZ99926.1 hypothetical protein J5289_28855 [Rhizobium sp. B230/85]